jgi:hypothetical protein
MSSTEDARRVRLTRKEGVVSRSESLMKLSGQPVEARTLAAGLRFCGTFMMAGRKAPVPGARLLSYGAIAHLSYAANLARTDLSERL